MGLTHVLWCLEFSMYNFVSPSKQNDKFEWFNVFICFETKSHISQTGLEHLILLTLTPTFWDYRGVHHTRPGFCIAGAEPRILFILAKHSPTEPHPQSPQRIFIRMTHDITINYKNLKAEENLLLGRGGPADPTPTSSEKWGMGCRVGTSARGSHLFYTFHVSSQCQTKIKAF